MRRKDENEMVNEQQSAIVFRNPVCKNTYDSLPKIYGSEKRKKGRRQSALTQVKRKNYLDFSSQLHYRRNPTCISRYLFAAKTQCTEPISSSNRAATENLETLNQLKNEEDRNKTRKIKTKLMLKAQSDIKCFHLDDLQSMHKVSSIIKEKVSCSLPQSGLSSLLIQHKNRTSKKPSVNLSSKLNMKLQPLALSKNLPTNEVLTGSKQQVTLVSDEVQTENYEPISNIRKRRFNPETQIEQENQSECEQSPLFSKKTKISSINSNAKQTLIKNRRAISLSSRVLNGANDESTMFRNLRKKSFESSQTQSRAKSRISSMLSEGIFFVPEKKDYQKYIKSYHSQDPKFSLSELFKKSPNFRIMVEDNSVYFGEIDDANNKHGQGVTVSEKQIFQGVYENNMKIFGYEKNLDGVYVGGFKNGLRNGPGTFQWNNGQFFTGNWEHGMKNGNGKWTSLQNYFYEGQWKNNRQHGVGIFKHALSTYKGSFQNFLKHGFGEEVFINGDKYAGEYKFGKPDGKGRYQWSNGSIYEGQFKQSLRQGHGRLEDFDGTVYEGHFENDSKQGFGKEWYASGQKFQGLFEHGKRKKGRLMGIKNEEIQILNQ